MIGTGALRGVRGLLIDADGTLMDGDAPVPGAPGLVRKLRERGLPLRVTTNTTRRPRSATAAALRRAGIEVLAEEVVVPAVLARRRVVQSGHPRAGLLVPEACLEDLEGVVRDETAPHWVVLGDLGGGFTYERLNQGFGWLRGGARLLALHRNPWWLAGERGPVLDAGAFVAALEFAAGVTAEVVGKPSPAFFELALEELGLPASEVVCVGDSVESDCAGAARAGCRTVLVRTGVFDEEAVRLTAARPDLVIDSIADLPLD